MNNLDIIGYIITALLGLVAYNGQQLIKKISEFEKKIEDIMISNVKGEKNIEVLRRDVDGHEVRITKLEKN